MDALRGLWFGGSGFRVWDVRRRILQLFFFFFFSGEGGLGGDWWTLANEVPHSCEL